MNLAIAFTISTFGKGKLFLFRKTILLSAPREAQNLEKMYLGGMFEGLPIYEEV